MNNFRGDPGGARPHERKRHIRLSLNQPLISKKSEINQLFVYDFCRVVCNEFTDTPIERKNNTYIHIAIRLLYLLLSSNLILCLQ